MDVSIFYMFVHAYLFPYDFAKVSLIVPTDNAPIMRKIPDNKIMAGIDDPSNGKMAKLTQEAIICGKQILPLNKPRYVPIFSPVNAFVRIVNGKVIMAAQAIPIRVKEITKSH